MRALSASANVLANALGDALGSVPGNALGAVLGARVSAALSTLSMPITGVPGMGVPGTGVPADLDPSGDEARRWVADELAGDGYRDTRSLFERLMRWLGQQLADLQDGQGTGGVSLPPFVITLVVVAAAVGIGYLLTRVRAEATTVADRRSVLGSSALTPEQLRVRGAAAMAENRWDDAVLDYTRAIARDADNRTLLTDAPALTAHEIGDQLAAVFPADAGAVHATTDLFDAVAYGGRRADRADAETVRSTEETLRRARPELTRTLAGSTPASSEPAARAGDSRTDPDYAESLWTTGTRR